MANVIIQNKNSKESTYKNTVGKTLPRDKTLGLDPDTCFYEIEDRDKNK